MTLCTIPSHKHGMRLAQGQTECNGLKNGMHKFNGRVVQLRTDAIPLHLCSKCNLMAAYFECNGEVK
jgi:hypothetical protein